MNDVVLPKFRLSLLGRFGLTGPDGRRRTAEQEACGAAGLSGLHRARAAVAREAAALLWGSHFDAQAKQNLRQALFRLRQVLGHDALMSDGEEVSLAPGVIDCDVARLEALSRRRKPRRRSLRQPISTRVRCWPT